MPALVNSLESWLRSNSLKENIALRACQQGRGPPAGPREGLPKDWVAGAQGFWKAPPSVSTLALLACLLTGVGTFWSHLREWSPSTTTAGRIAGSVLPERQHTLWGLNQGFASLPLEPPEPTLGRTWTRDWKQLRRNYM